MNHTKIPLVILGVLAVALFLSPVSVAAPLENDNFANAAVIVLTNTPFSDTSDLKEATTEPGEPNTSPSYVYRTLWYSFTLTADAMVRVDRPIVPPDPNPPTLCDLRLSRFLVVYRADEAGFAGLTQIGSHSVTFHALAGTTYYIQKGDFGDFSTIGCPDAFAFDVAVEPAPPNDDFADAIRFTRVPFSAGQDLTGATVEPDEPAACGITITKSAWYAFTPATSGSYGSADPAVDGINVYTGTSLADLTSVACSYWPGVFFWAEAGTTYYLQHYAGGMRIGAVPPPQVGFIYSPETPSTFDEVSFTYWIGGYWDPTVTGYAWDFGDGTTATGSPTSHRFTADGDYPVSLTVSARGGRTNTVMQTINVRTTKASGQGRFNTNGNGQVIFALSNETVLLDRIHGDRFSFAGTVESVTGSGNEATLTGTGTWNDQTGYTFEVLVADEAPWGRLKDTIDVVVRDRQGAVAFTSFGPQLLKPGDLVVTPPR